MNQVRDPVCGMIMDRDEATAFERHEPPYTVTANFVAPKFGSAGSGGLEDEPGPERHS
jgi:hypothetical protein